MNYYLTLDYELFLSSKTGTVKNCLLEPTTALLGILDKYGIKATFFVDAAYLLRLSQLKENHSVLKESFEKVCDHIRFLSMSGHSIQLHFHPQWLYSDYNKDGWVMDMDYYKLADMPADDVMQYLTDAVSLMNSLIQKPVTSFRAGGYSIMDFSSYSVLFKKLGIKNDTSVLRSKHCKSIYQNYDYREAPPKSKYSFTNSLVKEDPKGFFMEYPISTAKLNGLLSTFKLYYAVKRANSTDTIKWGDGKSVGSENGEKGNRLMAHLRMLLHPNITPASIDGGAILLGKVVQSSCKCIDGDEVVIIGHPKNLNRLSLRNLELFIKKEGAQNFKIL